MAELFNALQGSPTLQIVFSGLLGAVVGSFLNVVAYRLPLILDRQWRLECHDLLSPDTPSPEFPAPISLARPRSACPHCSNAIPANDNIPILSFLLLGGRCRHCRTPIPWHYPAVEMLTCLLTAYATWHFGWTIQTPAAWFMAWALIALALIDFKTMLLPDNITQPLLWAGLLSSLWQLRVPPEAAIIGAAAGYLSLWFIFHLFRLITGKEGMGYGDFKLFAALGAWLGWVALPFIILLAAAVGTIVGLALLVRNRGESQPLPFGPYLSAAGLIYLFWGPGIQHMWMRWLTN
jgi:leader peptidase (prepilin peptidase)/N-methyltransferase